MMIASRFRPVLPVTRTYPFGQLEPQVAPTQWQVPNWFLVLDTVSMAASAYHGYKRNNSIGWALWWGLMGAMFPVITPTIALAQGFGKPKSAVRNRRRRSRR